MPAKHLAVTYEGPSGSFTINGIVLRKGQAVIVEDDELRKELKEGSWRTEGHTFVTGPASDAAEVAGDDDNPGDDADN